MEPICARPQKGAGEHCSPAQYNLKTLQPPANLYHHTYSPTALNHSHHTVAATLVAPTTLYAVQRALA